MFSILVFVQRLELVASTFSRKQMHIAHTSKFFKNLYTTAYDTYLLETFFKFVFFSDFIWPLKYVHTYVYCITASKKASFFYVRIL